MDLFKNTLKQLKKIWSNSDINQRAIFIGLPALTLALIIGVGWFSSRPQYIPLNSGDLTVSQASELKSKLDARNIPNKLNFAGSKILVPTNRRSEALLAVGDDIQVASSPGFAPGILNPPAKEELARIQKQRQLAETLKRMPAIESADVLLAIPAEDPFESFREPTTASVVLTLNSGKRFGRRQANSVIAIVSRAVEGLLPENITVSDHLGNMFTKDASGSDAEIASRLEYQRSYEAMLVAKTEDMLTKWLGPNKATVQISADIDFTRMTTAGEQFDTSGNLKSSEDITTTKKQTIGQQGAAGVAANGNAGGGGAGNSSPVLENTETQNTVYVYPKRTQTVEKLPGELKRLTVAAIVDLSSDAVGADPAATGTAATDPKEVTVAMVEANIKSAIGFDDVRDEISVIDAPLIGAQMLDTPAPFPVWEVVQMVLRNGSLGLASLLAFVFGMKMLKQVKPITITTTKSSDADRAKALNEISKQAQENPEVMAKVLSAFLDKSDAAANQDEAAGTTAKKAA